MSCAFLIPSQRKALSLIWQSITLVTSSWHILSCPNSSLDHKIMMGRMWELSTFHHVSIDSLISIMMIFTASKLFSWILYQIFNNYFYYRKFYYPADAYNKSKLAQVFFTNYLETFFAQNELKIQSNSLHPGKKWAIL